VVIIVLSVSITVGINDIILRPLTMRVFFLNYTFIIILLIGMDYIKKKIIGAKK